MATPLTGLGAIYNPTAYGTVPQVPLPTTTAPGAIAGNLGNLGSLYGLSQGVGAASGAGAAAQYSSLLPGLSGYLGQAGANVASELAGVLPQDFINQETQMAAERGIGIGSPGSPNTNVALLKALGLSSLGQMQQGQSDLGKLIGETPTGPAFNPASMLVTPEQQQQAAAANAIYKSAPDPYAAAMANLAASQYGVPGATKGGGYTIGPGMGGGRGAAPTLAPSGQPSFAGGGAYAGAPAAAGGEDWVYDPQMGAYYNQVTGEYDFSGEQGGGGAAEQQLPPDTAYNPATDTTDYTYGLGGYYA